VHEEHSFDYVRSDSSMLIPFPFAFLTAAWGFCVAAADVQDHRKKIGA